MKNRTEGASRLLKNCVLGLAIIATACLFSVSGSAVQAQTQVALQSTPVVIRNDRGGLLRARLRQLGQLQQSRQPVQITGAVCYSTCTMFLGLPQTCISPDTTFGFHGPSSYGRALDPFTFNRASTVIASYYPAALRNWYLQEGRYRINSMYKMKGRQIINMGVRAC